MTCDRGSCGGAVLEDGFCNRCGRRPLSTGTSGTRQSGRVHLAGGLVELPAIAVDEPSTRVMAAARVAEHQRFCTSCREPVGRAGAPGALGRDRGFCSKCGAPFDFSATLARGDLVAGQYEVAGCLAHGGLGWIYLARDRKVADRWVVLKGLINSTDPDATDAALAERRFLAEVEHPNIVKIHNFVEHDNDGFIVMEFVNGVSLRQLMEANGRARGTAWAPIAAELAIACMLEVLPALGRLHELGLLFCDLKPENVILTPQGVKLIDLGGVYRLADEASTIYGTVGFQAREVPYTGPTVESDLYTVGRTLAVLATDFGGFQTTYRHALRDPADVELFRESDALYRLLERSTHDDPAARFHDASTMAAQLGGVLRQLIASRRGTPVPGSSTMFTPPPRAATDVPSWPALPMPIPDFDDAGAALVLALAASSPAEALERSESLPLTPEVQLFRVRNLLLDGDVGGAAVVISAMRSTNRRDWRPRWYAGAVALESGRADDALTQFTAVYRQLPGELAAALALGMASEAAGDLTAAITWYDIASRTDPSFTVATLGLSRCHAALGARAAAIAVLDRVAETSSAHGESTVAQVDLLLQADAGATSADDVVRASAVVQASRLDVDQFERLSLEVLRAALPLVLDGDLTTDRPGAVLGTRCDEHDVRVAIEALCLSLAGREPDRDRRVILVEQADAVRPRTVR